MNKAVKIDAMQCTCEVCGHEWVSTGKQLPECCANPKCRSRQWNGKKRLVKSHVNEIKFPAPRKGGRPKTITLIDVREGPCQD